MKRKSMACQQQASPLKKKINVPTLVGKAKVGYFRESEEQFLVEFSETGATFNSEQNMREF